MSFTADQFMEWVDETFPDNNLRAIAESNLRDGLKVLAQYVFDTNSSAFIQDSLEQVATLKDQAETAVFDSEAKRLATEALYNLVLNDKAATSLIKTQAQAILDNALTLTTPLGEWDAGTNTPELTAVPAAGSNGSYYDITGDGTATFAGSNFAVGASLASGGRLIKKSDTLYFYQKPTNLSLNKAIKLEQDTVIARLATEAFSPISANGGTAVASPPTITIPNGQTGYQSSLAQTQQLSAHPEYEVGKTLRFRIVLNKNVETFPNAKIFHDLNVNRGSTASNQSTNKSVIVEGTKLTLVMEYTILAGDIFVQPAIIVSQSGVSNTSGSDWSLTIQSISVEIVNSTPTVSRIGDEFNSMRAKQASQDLAIASKLINSSAVPTSFTGEALNGATGANTKRISIPTGQTGNSSYIRQVFPVSELPNFADMVGQEVTFNYRVLMSADFHPAKTLFSSLQITRAGSIMTATITHNTITKISPTVLQVSFRYTPNASDEILRPTLQNSGAGGAVAADAFFEVQEFTYSHAIPAGYPTENSYVATKEKAFLIAALRALQSRASTLETTAGKNVLTGSMVPESYNGEALNGATGGNTKRVSIPTGQTGNSSYVRALIPVDQIPNWSDMIGIPVTISYKILTSPDFNPAKTLVSFFRTTRSGADFTPAFTNNTVTKLSATVVKVQFTYTPDINDTYLKPYVQTGSAGGAVASDSFFEMQEITFSHAVPAGFPSDSSYYASKEKAWYVSLIKGNANRLTAVETQVGSVSTVAQVTLTVKPDGTGDYLSPKLANDAITDSSSAKKYEVIIYPGIYTETEWKPKPYTFWRGVDRETCWLKGELPDSADDSHRTTSTVWMDKTAAFYNLKITARNMRYAVHSEESGANVNALHNVFNCHLEHFGNQGMIAWRTANPGSGLTVAQVWAGSRPWGYGTASGVVENYENCTFASVIEAYYVHSNLNFAKPNVNNLKNCRLVRNGVFGRVIQVESLGSGQNNIVSLDGVSATPGFIRQSDSPWISQAAANQYANHAEFRVFAVGTSLMGYKDNTRGLALRIKSKSAAAGSRIRLTGDAVPLIFGPLIEVDGCDGLSGYAYGYWDISGILVGLSANVTVNNTIGRRLGDCTGANKVLTITADSGSPVSFVFDQNYTALSNATILGTLNASIASVAVADEYNPALNEYYPHFSEREITVLNSGAVGIPRFHAAGYNTDKSNVRLLTTADPAAKFLGVALENIAVGKTGRVLISGFLEKGLQIPGVTGAVSLDTEISLSTTVNGQFELGSAKVVMQGIATDWAQFAGKY